MCRISIATVFPFTKISRKIQSIYNGKCAPITMQGFAQAAEIPLAQEQWRTMKKAMRRAIGIVGKSGQVLTVRLDAGRQGDGAARESGENEKSPPMSSGGRQSHKSETRISAIADFARKGKREKKTLPLSPRGAACRSRGTSSASCPSRLSPFRPKADGTVVASLA